MRNHHRIVSALLVASFATAACSGGERAGDIVAPGAYAVNGGHLIRLDGPIQWEEATWGERAELDEDLTLLLYDPAIDQQQPVPPADVIRLSRVAFLRNEISVVTGERTQPGERRWVSTELAEFEVPVDVVWAPDRSGAVQAIPRLPLEPGLYAVRMQAAAGTVHGRFGVDWDDVDMEEYGALYCVERYVDGVRSALDRCDAVDAGTQGLAIRELEPVRRTVGETEVLIVDGNVTNRSERPRRVPPLIATLSGDANAELQSWTFAAESAYLLPGNATTFRTELRDPPSGVSNVHVEFAANP